MESSAFTINQREVQTPEQKPTLIAVRCYATLVGDQQRRTERGLKEESPLREHPPEAQCWVKTVLVAGTLCQGP